MTKEEKRNAVNNTIMALNAGTDEAITYAYQIKQDVIKNGDKELIKQIEYLWDVI